MDDLYIDINNEATGPFTLMELQRMLDAGEIKPQTLYAKSGMTSWKPVSTILQPSAMLPDQEPIPATLTTSNAVERLVRCGELLETFESLSTFVEGQGWIKMANDEVARYTPTLDLFDHLIRVEELELQSEKDRFEHQSFLKRTFGRHEAEEPIKARISSLRKQRADFVDIAERIQAKVGLVPVSPTGRDLIVKEIRHRIKELKAEKKEATAAMTSIRREARVASDGAGKTWLGLYDSYQAAAERRGIRHAKERALQPYEDTKESTERQIIALEKHLIWLENFS